MFSPCSVHNVPAAIEYAKLLSEYAAGAKDDLHIVMRVYFEKPRTTVGWKGLINDPDMNGSFQINKGLRIARTLLLEVAKMGLPAGCEFLGELFLSLIIVQKRWKYLTRLFSSYKNRYHHSPIHRRPCLLGCYWSTYHGISSPP